MLMEKDVENWMLETTSLEYADCERDLNPIRAVGNFYFCVYVCVRACVRACVRVCVILTNKLTFISSYNHKVTLSCLLNGP